MSQEKRNREARFIKKQGYLDPDTIRMLIVRERFIRYTIPFEKQGNATSVTADNWFKKDHKCRPTSLSDHRPLIVSFSWYLDEQYYHLLTREHWLQCLRGVPHRNKFDKKMYESRLIHPNELPRIDRKTYRMFKEDAVFPPQEY